MSIVIIIRTTQKILKQDGVFLAPPTDCSAQVPELGDILAELVFNRRLRTTLPSLPGTLSPRAVNRDDWLVS